MTTAAEIGAVLVVIVGVFGALVLVAQWTRFFADWLWLFASAPKLTAGVTLVVVVLVALGIRLVSNIAVAAPLAFAVELLLTPFLTAYAANGAAFLHAKRKGHTASSDPWRTYIFDARRLAQRDAYEAPRNEPA